MHWFTYGLICYYIGLLKHLFQHKFVIPPNVNFIITIHLFISKCISLDKC